MKTMLWPSRNKTLYLFSDNLQKKRLCFSRTTNANVYFKNSDRLVQPLNIVRLAHSQKRLHIRELMKRFEQHRGYVQQEQMHFCCYHFEIFRS